MQLVLKDTDLKKKSVFSSLFIFKTVSVNVDNALVFDDKLFLFACFVLFLLINILISSALVAKCVPDLACSKQSFV